MAKTQRLEIDCDACFCRTSILYTDAPPVYCPVCGEKQEDLYDYSDDLDFED
jgi:Zn finger protein HypA/HybF involved in hydrogenase expression